MLTRAHRLVSSRRFSSTVRRGRHAGTRTVVLHLLTYPCPDEAPGVPFRVQVGFVVNKAVGPAVTRNRVKRRLRHIVRERLGSLPDSAALVVRALPASGRVPYTALHDDFDSALVRLVRAEPAGSGR